MRALSSVAELEARLESLEARGVELESRLCDGTATPAERAELRAFRPRQISSSACWRAWVHPLLSGSDQPCAVFRRTAATQTAAAAG